MSSNAELVELTGKYLIPNYGRLPLAMVRGQGTRIWDADGKEYLDFFAGFGTGLLGHCHPAIVAALQAQAGQLLSHGNLFTNAPQVELARAITEHGFGGKVFFCHSGAEANEAALKLARLAAGAGRYKIISFHNAFHGRTMGALSLTPEKYQKGFEPMLPGNVKVNFGDLAAVRAAIDGETAAVITEPIQGEGGVHVPDVAYMKGLRKLCDEKNILLICDEVWTAPARTGRWFAYQHFDIQPDVMTLGKAVGGGAPVAACVAGPKVADVLKPGTHGCTVGGNPLCAAAGAAAMRTIEQENLVQAAVTKGQMLTSAIKAANIAKVKEVRGRGLMLGIELDCPGKGVFAACLKAGLIINVTQDTVVRLAPPLTTPESQLQQAADILIAALRA